MTLKNANVIYQECAPGLLDWAMQHITGWHCTVLQQPQQWSHSNEWMGLVSVWARSQWVWALMLGWLAVTRQLISKRLDGVKVWGKFKFFNSKISALIYLVLCTEKLSNKSSNPNDRVNHLFPPMGVYQRQAYPSFVIRVIIINMVKVVEHTLPEHMWKSCVLLDHPSTSISSQHLRLCCPLCYCTLFPS